MQHQFVRTLEGIAHRHQAPLCRVEIPPDLQVLVFAALVRIPADDAFGITLSSRITNQVSRS